jgi:hypothetical protein
VCLLHAERTLCIDPQGKPFIVSQSCRVDEGLAEQASCKTPPLSVRVCNLSPLTTTRARRNPMSSKKQPVVVRKASKKIADSRRVRFGSGSAPRVLRTVDTATHDSGKVRFGSGSAPASLRK